MARKQQKIEYVTKFDLCDRAHFDIIKGISVTLWLASLICVNYLDMAWTKPFGNISLALCLLCSGYGVSQSFIRKGGLVHYWENKMIKIWLPSVVTVILFSYIIYGDAVVWIEKNPLAFAGKQLYIFFAEYLIFWAIYTYISSEYGGLICLFATSAIAFAVVQDKAYAPYFFCFPVGVLFSQLSLRSKARSLTVPKRLLLCGTLLVLAVAGIFLQRFCTGYIANAIGAVLYTSAAALIIFGSYYLKIIPIFGIFVPAGNIAYCLYLIAPYMLYLLRNWMTGYKILAVVFVIAVIAAVLSWLRELLIMYNRKLRQSKNTRLKGMM